MNFTLSVTPAVFAFAFASLMRSGSMSMPTPRAPYFCAAVMTMRPSPHPRSYTVSFAVTAAIFIIVSTISSGVGTKITSGPRVGAAWSCAPA